MRENNEFVVFPRKNVVGVFEDAASLRTAVAELLKSGFALDDIRTFVGDEGMRNLDFDGSTHGSLTEMLRSLQHIGPDRTYLERYEKYMREGDCILMVYAPHEEQKNRAAEIVHKSSIHPVTYFGTLIIEEV